MSTTLHCKPIPSLAIVFHIPAALLSKTLMITGQNRLSPPLYLPLLSVLPSLLSSKGPVFLVLLCFNGVKSKFLSSAPVLTLQQHGTCCQSPLSCNLPAFPKLPSSFSSSPSVVCSLTRFLGGSSFKLPCHLTLSGKWLWSLFPSLVWRPSTNILKSTL